MPKANETMTLESGGKPDRATSLMLDRIERQLRMDRDENNKPQYSIRDWDVQHLIQHLRNLEAVCDEQEQLIADLERTARAERTGKLNDQVAQLEAEVARLRKELALAQRENAKGPPAERVRARKDWAAIKEEWRQEQTKKTV